MDSITHIYWTIQTAGSTWAGTDDRVTIKIFNDNQRLLFANVEPGGTTRLDIGEKASYFWKFTDPNPSGIGVSYSGYTPPFTVDFPNGIEGHLRCIFEIHGDDLWRVLDINSTVLTGQTRHVPGTIDSLYWEPIPKLIYFPGDDILSTDPSEGVRRLTLNY